VQSSIEPTLINISYFDLVLTLKKVIKKMRIEARFNYMKGYQNDRYTNLTRWEALNIVVDLQAKLAL